MEQKAENVFRLYKNELLQKLGRKALNSDTIDNILSCYFKANTKVAMHKTRNFN